MTTTRPTNEPRRAEARRVMAVCGGKGGLGASMLAANLAIFLAQIGRRVLLVDAGLGGATTHHWLAEEAPAASLADLLLLRAAEVGEVVQATRVPGLSWVAGPPNAFFGPGLDASDMGVALSELWQLDFDHFVLDLPSGRTPLGLDRLAGADTPILVTLATPDAVAATYHLASAVFLRRLWQESVDVVATHDRLEELATRPGAPPTPREVVAGLAAMGSPLHERARRLAVEFCPHLVVNQTRVRSDEQLGEAMVSAATRWLGIVPQVLGAVEWDDNVWLALRRGQQLLVDFPQSRACKDLEHVVRRLVQPDAEPYLPDRLPPTVEEQNHYELLELYPAASEEEVRRAAKRVRDLFGAKALAVSGVCSEPERVRYLERCEEAHAVLVDKAKRRAYDLATFPEGQPTVRVRPVEEERPRTLAVPRAVDQLPRTTVPPEQAIDGPFLSALRRRHGLELQEVSARIKVSVGYLAAIEEERFEDLPSALVYVRGFVTELARFLKVDPARAARDVLARHEAWRRRREKERLLEED